MKKLIKGLLDFQRHGMPAYRQTFARLAKGQSPDALFISCSDSRVVPNTFASTDPGDLFVVRNVGNMVPPADAEGCACGDTSEASAVEYAVLVLGVTDIVVCGHSSCGAMGALVDGNSLQGCTNLNRWLELGAPARARLHAGELRGVELSEQDRLSQLNVLQQLEHLQTYPLVRTRVARGELRLRAWWFDIGAARVSTWREELGRFVFIDEAEGERLLAELEADDHRRLSASPSPLASGDPRRLPAHPG